MKLLQRITEPLLKIVLGVMTRSYNNNVDAIFLKVNGKWVKYVREDVDA